MYVILISWVICSTYLVETCLFPEEKWSGETNARMHHVKYSTVTVINYKN